MEAHGATQTLSGSETDKNGQGNLPVFSVCGLMPHPHVRRRRGGAGRQSGFITVMLAALILPLIGMLGLIFDIGQSRLVQERLYEAVRIAALSGVRDFDAGDRDTRIVSMLELNFPTTPGSALYGVTRPQATDTTPLLSELQAPVSNWADNPKILATTNGNDNQLLVSVVLTVPTLLMRVFLPETHHMTVGASARAVRHGPGPAYSYNLME